MIKKILLVLVLMCFALPCFAKKSTQEEVITPLTQLEKRQFQTRTYKATDKQTVMKALLNVYQDEGFMVYNANHLLGFIYGTKDFDTSDPDIDISKEFGLSKGRLNVNGVKVATLETSANVTEYGETIRVRVNFKRKLLNIYGNAQFIEDVNEDTFYTDFFEKLETAIILQHK